MCVVFIHKIIHRIRIRQEKAENRIGKGQFRI